MKTKVALIATLALICSLTLAPFALADGKADIIAGIKAAQAKQPEEAVKLFTKAIRSGTLSKANLAIAYNNRGSAKDDLGNMEWALLDYNKAIEVDPNYAEAYYNRSYLFQRMGQIGKALADAAKAASLKPDDEDYRTRLNYLRGFLKPKR